MGMEDRKEENGTEEWEKESKCAIVICHESEASSLTEVEGFEVRGGERFDKVGDSDERSGQGLEVQEKALQIVSTSPDTQELGEPQLISLRDENDNKNIGAQIMQKYEEDKQKLKEIKNLPDVSLLDVDESIEDIEKERRRIIENQAVRAKRIDSWIKGFGDFDDVDLSFLQESNMDSMSTESQHTETDGLFNYLTIPGLLKFDDCEIVCDSILENKEKTKSYWERLMLAAEAVSGKGGGGGEESVVERDIRQQKEREAAVALEREEALRLARARQEDTLPSIDEGNFSGSEEKSLDGTTSRVMTPEVEFSHQRTPSYESMSSGHSSGSEFGTRRRPSVKPIDEPQEPELPAFIRNQKETPIEKEIRLVKEREDELKREKRTSMPVLNNNKDMVVKVNRQNNNMVATKRIQKEIEINSERDKDNDLKASSKDVSIQTKDNIKNELQAVSLKKCVSMSSIPLALQREVLDSNQTPGKCTVGNNVKIPGAISSVPLLNNKVTPKLFTPNRNQKGLMKRFLESHGRMGPTFTFSTSPTTTTPQSVGTKNSDTGLNKKIITDKVQTDKQENILSSRRPGYRSTEDKIQRELEEMKKREAELRKERARTFGKSQPNLQKIGMEEDDEEDIEVRFPTMGKLRTALSNPNLLENKPAVQKAPHKRRSALIDEWENRIRKEQ